VIVEDAAFGAKERRGLIEDRVVRADERRGRAEVLGEKDARAARTFDGLPGIEVGEDVGATKRVDGLLGIADHGQHVPVGAVEEDLAKDPPLHLVRVLKLVDQRVPVARAQGRDQGALAGTLALQPLGHQGQHVLKVEAAGLALV
jgi:hypothetical protein